VRRVVFQRGCWFLGLGYGKTLREGREVSLSLAKYERWVQY
jgi:hypothetical protein